MVRRVAGVGWSAQSLGGPPSACAVALPTTLGGPTALVRLANGELIDAAPGKGAMPNQRDRSGQPLLRAAGEVLSLLQAAAREMGQAILMVTHDPKAAAHADRVVYLADGRIVRTEGSGTPEQIAATMLNLEA